MVCIRANLQIKKNDEVKCFFNDSVTNQSDKKEFIANDKYESKISHYNENGNKILFDDIIFKSNFVKTFNALMPSIELTGTETVLEMGASHGWASVLLKKEFPDCYVVASDLVPDTLKHAKRWEHLLDSYLDEKWAFNCRDIPFEDKQFDRIFTFASFHHFGDNGDYTRSIEELMRVLKEGGKIMLLYEPSSPKYLYRFAFNRANRRREIDGVDEDVLVPSNIAKIVKEKGGKFSANFFPIYLYRDGIVSTNYYYILSKFKLLQKLLASTVNITIEKIK